MEPSPIELEIIKIILKMPKNEADIQFIRSIQYAKWNKEGFFWAVPHYPGNLERIKQYFGERISNLTEREIIDLGEAEVMEFSFYLVNERRVSASFQNQAINALKFYFEKVKGGERKYYHIDRPVSSNGRKQVPKENHD